jgi:hypothetical protein
MVRRYSWQFWLTLALVDGVGLSVLTPQKKCRMKMISCRGATCGALYSSLKGRLCPCASSTSRSPTRSRSFSVGMSLLTSMVPSNSSCPLWRIGVWLEGENGGVERPGASRDVDTLDSTIGAASEGGGEGGCATAAGVAGVVVVGGSAEPAGLLSVVSMLAVSAVSCSLNKLRDDVLRAQLRKAPVPGLEAEDMLSIAGRGVAKSLAGSPK